MMECIIVSCDKYAWVVPICIEFLKRAGMPYPITVVTNKVHIDYPNTVYVGEDESWSSNLLKWLPLRKEPFILWNDNAICESINLPLLEKAVEVSTHSDVGMVRLLPTPGPTMPYSKDIGEFNKKLPNAVSCQSSIWHPETLRVIAREHESAWNFELCGSMRAMDYTEKKFLGMYEYAVLYSDYIKHKDDERTENGIPEVDPNVQKMIDKCRFM